jgi:hypothetical protein
MTFYRHEAIYLVAAIISPGSPNMRVYTNNGPSLTLSVWHTTLRQHASMVRGIRSGLCLGIGVPASQMTRTNFLLFIFYSSNVLLVGDNK